MKRSFLALLLTVASFVSLSAYAQTPDAAKSQTGQPASEQRQWLLVTEVSVKPEMMVEFQNFIKNETNPALRKGGLKWRDVWQRTDLAGSPFEYIIVAPFDNFAQYDGGNPVEKGLGKEGYAAWLAKAGRFVTSVRRTVVRTRPDLSHQVKRTGPPKLGVATSIRVAPGRSQDFANFLKNDYMPVMKQGGATYLVAETIFGEDVDEFITLTLRENFAEIDKGPVPVQVLGAEEAAKLLQKLPTGIVSHVKRSFVRYVPELSIMSPEISNK